MKNMQNGEIRMPGCSLIRRGLAAGIADGRMFNLISGQTIHGDAS